MVKKKGGGGTAGISCTYHSKRQWGPQSFFNKCKKTLGGKEMDTLDPGKEKTLNILQVAKKAWIRPPVLMSSTPSPPVQINNRVHCNKIYTYIPLWSPKPTVQGKCIVHLLRL